MEEVQHPTLPPQTGDDQIQSGETEDSNVTSTIAVDTIVTNESPTVDSTPLAEEPMEVDEADTGIDVSETAKLNEPVTTEATVETESIPTFAGNNENEPSSSTENVGKDIDTEQNTSNELKEHEASLPQTNETSIEGNKNDLDLNEEKGETDAHSQVSKDESDTLGLESAESSKEKEEISKDIVETKDCDTKKLGDEQVGVEDEKESNTDSVNNENETNEGQSVEDVQKYIDDTSNEEIDRSSAVIKDTKDQDNSVESSQENASSEKYEEDVKPNDVISNEAVKSQKLESEDLKQIDKTDELKSESFVEEKELKKDVNLVTDIEENKIPPKNTQLESEPCVDKKEDQKIENNKSSEVESPEAKKLQHSPEAKKPLHPAISKVLTGSSKKQDTPKRRSRRDPVIATNFPNLHYLDNETNFGGFYPEYFDSTIYMYRGYWTYVQEEMNIPCRPLPPYKTSFYLNYTPSSQPVVQTSSGRVVKKREFSPPAPVHHTPSAKKEVPVAKPKESAEERTKRKYRIPLEKFGWKREVVFRNSINHPAHTADVYYYSPAGKKLRSIREIVDTLREEDELKPYMFTFVKELLGFEEPLEVSREAFARTLASSDDAKRAKPTPVSRKSFFDKNSSKSETKVISMNGKVRKPGRPSLTTSEGSNKRTHDDMEEKPISPEKASPHVNTVKPTNGDVTKTKTPEHTKVQPSVKTSGEAKKRKLTTSNSKPSSEHKKPLVHQSENKVPNTLGSSANAKHKTSDTKSPSSKKLKLETPDPAASSKKLKLDPPEPAAPPIAAPVKLVPRVIHSNKNIVNDISNQFNAIVYLCRYLRVEDLLRVARVNRLFNAAAHSHQLWQVVKLKNSKVRDWTGLADCLTKHGTHTLDMLKMIGSADPDENDEIWNRFYKVIGKIHSLRRLELGRVTAAEILNAASNCSKNLTEFSVIAQKLATIDLKLFQGLPNLEILQLRSFESKREYGLIMMNIPLLSNMRQLRHLSLTGVKNLKSYQATLLKDFPPLLSLELGDCTKLDERFPECSLAHMTSLVRLRLEMVQGNTANKFVETIATLPRLKTLELINIDTKKGFDEVFGRLTRVEHLLIFPTYITQSSTTNWLVLSGLARLKSSLRFLTWGLTQELLRVTTLFIEQWNAQLNLDDGVTRLDPEELKKTTVESNSIPVMKPLPELFEAVHTAGKAEGSKQNISELDILPIDELKSMLEKVLCDTKIKLITVPVSSTTRIYLPSN